MFEPLDTTFTEQRSKGCTARHKRSRSADPGEASYSFGVQPVLVLQLAAAELLFGHVTKYVFPVGPQSAERYFPEFQLVRLQDNLLIY